MKRTPLKRGKRIRRSTSARKMKQVIDLKVKEQALVRDNFACVRCGKRDNLQAAHLLPKGLYPRMRFELDNILTLDVGCHLFFAHKDPLGFAAFVNEKYPGLYDRLRERARVAGKINLKALYAELGR